MKLVIDGPGATTGDIKPSSNHMEAVDLKLSLNVDDINRLKTLAAAFLCECDRLTDKYGKSARELAVAKTNMQTASMWAIYGVTKGF